MCKCASVLIIGGKGKGERDKKISELANFNWGFGYWVLGFSYKLFKVLRLKGLRLKG